MKTIFAILIGIVLGYILRGLMEAFVEPRKDKQWIFTKVKGGTN